MAHVILTTSEFKKLKTSCKLPDQTTLVEEKEDGTPIKVWQLKYDEFVLIKDLVELAKPFKSEKELKKFRDTFDEVKLIDYFVCRNHDENNVPQREYSACDDLEYELFKHIHHDSSYIEINDKSYNIFKIYIGKKDYLSVAEIEVNLLLDRIKKHWPKLKKHEFLIFEHNLSEFGIYSLILEDSVWSIIKTTYGQPRLIEKFDSLMDCLKYIQENLWYD